jgi:cobalamin biosynthesis protein CobT
MSRPFDEGSDDRKQQSLTSFFKPSAANKASVVARAAGPSRDADEEEDDENEEGEEAGEENETEEEETSDRKTRSNSKSKSGPSKSNKRKAASAESDASDDDARRSKLKRRLTSATPVDPFVKVKPLRVDSLRPPQLYRGMGLKHVDCL